MSTVNRLSAEDYTVTYHNTLFLVLRILRWSCNIPYNNASAVGGQPGTYMSTGTMPAEKKDPLEWLKLILRNKHTVTSSDNRVRVVIVTTTISARAHRDNPP